MNLKLVLYQDSFLALPVINNFVKTVRIFCTMSNGCRIFSRAPKRRKRINLGKCYCGKTSCHENKCFGASGTEECEIHPKMIDSLLILLICFAKNTHVSLFINGHFLPMPYPFLSNAPSLIPLSHCSLSLPPSLSAYFPTQFLPVGNSHKYSDDFIDRIIE